MEKDWKQNWTLEKVASTSSQSVAFVTPFCKLLGILFQGWLIISYLNIFCIRKHPSVWLPHTPSWGGSLTTYSLEQRQRKDLFIYHVVLENEVHDSSSKLLCFLFVKGLGLILLKGYNWLHLWRISSIHITSSPLEVEGLGRCSIGTTVRSSESLLLANFERASAWECLECGIRVNSNFLKVGTNSMTNFK